MRKIGTCRESITKDKVLSLALATVLRFIEITVFFQAGVWYDVVPTRLPETGE